MFKDGKLLYQWYSKWDITSLRILSHFCFPSLNINELKWFKQRSLAVSNITSNNNYTGWLKKNLTHFENWFWPANVFDSIIRQLWWLAVSGWRNQQIWFYLRYDILKISGANGFVHEMLQHSIWNKSVLFRNKYFDPLGCRMYESFCILKIIFMYILFKLSFQTLYTFIVSNGALWRFVDKPMLHQLSSKHHISVTIQPNVLLFVTTYGY